MICRHFFGFALEFTIRKVQEELEGLKLIRIHQFLAYTDDVNMLGGSIRTINEKAEVLIADSKETAKKTKHMLKSCEQNA
jgi:CO dehydrogenase/acetyl-CoA synthase beta subunit